MNQKIQRALNFFEYCFADNVCPPYTVWIYDLESEHCSATYEYIAEFDRDEYIEMFREIRDMADRELKKMEDSLDGRLELEDREAPSNIRNVLEFYTREYEAERVFEWCKRHKVNITFKDIADKYFYKSIGIPKDKLLKVTVEVIEDDI